MLDLAIRGGMVITPTGAGLFDLGVQNGMIVEVTAPGYLPSDSTRSLEAAGMIVSPGGIDPHVHCSWPLMHEVDGHALHSAPPSVASRAALFGGTTTLIDFAVCDYGSSLDEAATQFETAWKGACYTDHTFHFMLRGAVSQQVLDDIPSAIAAGHQSFKLFTTDVTPSRRGRKLLFGDIAAVMRQTAVHGGIVAVHAEDDDLVMYNYGRLEAEGRVGFENVHEVHDALSEEIAFLRVIRLAEYYGARTYMMHVSTAAGVAAIARSRGNGFPIHGETLHQYALFTSDDYKKPNGQIYHTYPSLKRREDCDALWQGMERGTIGSIGTDAIYTSLEDKVRGLRIDDVTGGSAGLEPRVALIYTEGVTNRGFSLERFADLISTNAARCFGLYPKKGAIAPGSDADMTLIDPKAERTVRAADLHETGYSPWEGHRVSAWPVTTVLRGKVMVESGRFSGELTDGQLLRATS